MQIILFTSILTVILAAILLWGFKTLPGENRQILAVVPKIKNADHSWTGLNLTWYGAISASSLVISVALLLILAKSINIPFSGTIGIITMILIICVPSAKLIALIVEHKKHTFTVGGASFTGIIIAPWIIFLANLTAAETTGFQVPLLEMLAALSICYAIGEGLGRLGCISFGCCFGKPLDQCSPLTRRLFSKFNFVFYGKTRKVSYAAGLEGVKTFPVQALTAIIYCATGILSAVFFLKGYHGTAYIVSLSVTQAWRLFSETLRADYRGDNKITPYQIMALTAAPYSVFIAFLFPSSSLITPDILTGLLSLWNPIVIILLQGLWVWIFYFMGRSMVTSANLTFDVVYENI